MSWVASCFGLVAFVGAICLIIGAALRTNGTRKPKL